MYLCADLEKFHFRCCYLVKLVKKLEDSNVLPQLLHSNTGDVSLERHIPWALDIYTELSHHLKVLVKIYSVQFQLFGYIRWFVEIMLLLNCFLFMFAGLRAILEDPRTNKLFYDCRGDCNALKHQYNVEVNGKQWH